MITKDDNGKTIGPLNAPDGSQAIGEIFNGMVLLTLAKAKIVWTTTLTDGETLAFVKALATSALRAKVAGVGA
jgi:hypothetical protein